LSIHDFELVRTLGTGACCFLLALGHAVCYAAVEGF
jgi:hypothetical protein